MRDNLIFTGISEPTHNGGNDEPETEDVEQTLRTFNGKGTILESDRRKTAS